MGYVSDFVSNPNLWANAYSAKSTNHPITGVWVHKESTIFPRFMFGVDYVET